VSVWPLARTDGLVVKYNKSVELFWGSGKENVNWPIYGCGC
jgi:hypothetical protein